MDKSDSISQEAVIERISHDEENNRCFECGAVQPLWASVNNGIMICLDCAGHHRNIGDVNVSRVRSINLDMWAEKQLKLMEEGGNTRFKAFLQTYLLDEIHDIKVKYNTKAASYYRRMIEAKATMQDFDELKLSLSEGRCLIDGRALDLDGNIIEEPDLDFIEVDEVNGENGSEDDPVSQQEILEKM